MLKCWLRPDCRESCEKPFIYMTATDIAYWKVNNVNYPFVNENDHSLEIELCFRFERIWRQAELCLLSRTIVSCMFYYWLKGRMNKFLCTSTIWCSEKVSFFVFFIFTGQCWYKNLILSTAFGGGSVMAWVVFPSLKKKKKKKANKPCPQWRQSQFRAISRWDSATSGDPILP